MPSGPKQLAFGITPDVPRPRNRVGTLIAFAALAGAVGLIVCAGVAMLTYGSRRHMVGAEAVNTVGEIGKHVQQSYEKNGALCPSATPIPGDFWQVHGQTFTSAKLMWTEDPGWSCLDFQLEGKQHYQYRYERVSDVFFTVTAVGDLDGNEIRSTFTMEGHVDPAKNELVVSPNIQRTNPEE